MNNWHLVWVVPLLIAIGFGIGVIFGVQIGFETFDTMGEIGCNLSTDILNFQSNMIYNMTMTDGNCSTTFENYMIDNKDEFEKIYNNSLQVLK